MKIMCDTNIILDVLLDRVPFSTDSAKVLDCCALRLWEGFTTASCITDIYYFTYKYLHDHDMTQPMRHWVSYLQY